MECNAPPESTSSEMTPEPDDELRLFDPTPYTIPTKRAKRRRVRKPTGDTVAVRTDSTWRLVSKKTPGILHAARPEAKRPLSILTLAACGVAATACRFDDGQLANGCGQCARLLARRPGSAGTG